MHEFESMEKRGCQMKEYEGKMEKFLKHEWDEEVKQIDEDVMSDSDSYDAAPAELKEQVMQKIEEYEREKAYEHLTDEDKEAIRLGRELLAQKNAGRSGRKKSSKRKKVYILAASVAVLVLGLGMTSIGGKRYLIEAMNQMLGERELVQVDSKEEDRKTSGVNNEEAAYQEVKDKFGFDPVRPFYKPKEMKFVDADIDEDLQCATLFYESKDESLFYNMNTNYTDGAFGFDTEDVLIEEYTMTVSEIPVLVKAYKKQNDMQSRLTASFEYKNIYYILNGSMKKAEFDEILKNLYFY